jgi:hypothetical protein
MACYIRKGLSIVGLPRFLLIIWQSLTGSPLAVPTNNFATVRYMVSAELMVFSSAWCSGLCFVYLLLDFLHTHVCSEFGLYAPH